MGKTSIISSPPSSEEILWEYESTIESYLLARKGIFFQHVLPLVLLIDLFVFKFPLFYILIIIELFILMFQLFEFKTDKTAWMLSYCQLNKTSTLDKSHPYLTYKNHIFISKKYLSIKSLDVFRDMEYYNQEKFNIDQDTLKIPWNLIAKIDFNRTSNMVGLDLFSFHQKQGRKIITIYGLPIAIYEQMKNTIIQHSLLSQEKITKAEDLSYRAKHFTYSIFNIFSGLAMVFLSFKNWFENLRDPTTIVVFFGIFTFFWGLIMIGRYRSINSPKIVYMINYVIIWIGLILLFIIGFVSPQNLMFYTPKK